MPAVLTLPPGGRMLMWSLVQSFSLCAQFLQSSLLFDVAGHEH